ncbi:MAG: CPXCG motif-containing cysteine-rich protein [Anaerolineales bacterium]
MCLNTHAAVICPHCGEQVDVDVDPSGGRQQRYIEDCWVCCRPIEVVVEVRPTGEIDVDVLPSE